MLIKCCANVADNGSALDQHLGQRILFAWICIVQLLLLVFGSEKVGSMTSISYRDHKQKNDHTNVHRPIIILTDNPYCLCDSLLVFIVGLLWARYVPQSQIITATDDSRSTVL